MSSDILEIHLQKCILLIHFSLVQNYIILLVLDYWNYIVYIKVLAFYQ